MYSQSTLLALVAGLAASVSASAHNHAAAHLAMRSAPSATASPANSTDATRLTHHAPIDGTVAKVVKASKIVARQLLTCEQSYGAGSVKCGGADSTQCYNPTKGEVCCPADQGYCVSGQYCAPVVGYCCAEGEDAATCARNAGFDLPASFTGTSPAQIVTPAPVTPDDSTPTGATVTVTVSQCPPTETTIPVPAPVTKVAQTPTAAVVEINASVTPYPTVAQVSEARKEDWTVVWTSMGFAGMALLMLHI